MFKDVPEVGRRRHGDPVDDALPRASARTASPKRSSTVEDDTGQRAVRDFPDLFFPSICVDPNEGMEALRKIDRYADEFDLQCGRRVPVRASTRRSR